MAFYPSFPLKNYNSFSVDFNTPPYINTGSSGNYNGLVLTAVQYDAVKEYDPQTGAILLSGDYYIGFQIGFIFAYNYGTYNITVQVWDPKNYSEQVLYAIYYYTLIPVSPGQYVNMTLAVTSSNNPYAVFNGQKYNFPLTFVLSSSDVVQLTPLGSFSIKSSNSLVPSFAIEGNYYNLPSSLFVSASIYNR